MIYDQIHEHSCKIEELEKKIKELNDEIILNKPDLEGNTPLHKAIINNDLERVKYLIEKKVEVNRYNNQGLHSIHLAAITGNIEIVKLLLNTTKSKYMYYIEPINFADPIHGYVARKYTKDPEIAKLLTPVINNKINGCIIS
jgi:ankyrin repeat protein